jgi:hypothetical protein
MFPTTGNIELVLIKAESNETAISAVIEELKAEVEMLKE